MTITTNTSTPNDPTTFVRLRQECETLLELARGLEGLALENPTQFSANEVFRATKAEFQAYVLTLMNLSGSV